MPNSRDRRTTAIQDHRGHRPKEIRTQLMRWSPEAENAFLDTLATTCNVLAAVDACGFSSTTVYYQRRHNPGFAMRWQEALELGYERLEARLLEMAERSLTAPLTVPAEDDELRISIPQAIQMLQLWRRTVKEGVARRGGRPRHEPDLDELRAGIARKLEAIERADERS
jgi:hypothetical protein